MNFLKKRLKAARDEVSTWPEWEQKCSSSSRSPACSIAPALHPTLQAVVDHADSIGYPEALHSERDSFLALIDAVNLRLNYLELKAQ